MTLDLFHVDAFTSSRFAGNPAAVCPLEHWLDDALMQAIAAENNLSETAFIVPEADGFRLRWFTPEIEVDLCGHATLATAFVLFEKLGWPPDRIRFFSRSGELTVGRDGELLALDFPARPPTPAQAPRLLTDALQLEPVEFYESRDYMAVFSTEAEVRSLRPSMELLKQLGHFALIVTAPGQGVDFVSRFFAPAAGIPEDPVTGSAHCTLVPYWSARLGKKNLHALQVSARGGELWCEDCGDRVLIAGRAVLYLEGKITI